MRNLKKILIIMILIPSLFYPLVITIMAEKKSQICATCHGVDGISRIKTYPMLAGQHINIFSSLS